MNTQSKIHKILWMGWLIASIFYAFQYIVRVLPNIMFHDLIQQFHIDSIQFGQFSGIYYIGYSLMHLPIGILLDRYGPKKIMTLCILTTTIGMIPMIYSTNWIIALIGRLLIGIGSSGAILGTFKIIRLCFEEHYFTRMLSFSVTIGLLGAIYGGGPIAYLSQTFGYQSIIYGLCILGFLLALITYLILPPSIQKPSKPVLSDIRNILQNKKVLAICFLAGLMVGPLEGFADVWGSEFFKKVYNLDVHLSSYLVSTIFVGMCFGAPLLSFIAEKTNSYFGTIIFSAITMCFVFSIILLTHISYSVIIFLFIIVGICCAYQILAIYKASTYVDEQQTGLTTALANMIIMIFGYFFHTLIGLTINIFGGIQSPEAFIKGIALIPLTLLISAIGYIKLASQR